MPTTLACHCGHLRLDVEKTPIISSECYCDSCRAAAEILEALPGAKRLTNRHGGTRFVLYRKDRIRFVEGIDVLREFRLTPQSPTRRVIATCCQTPVFLEFRNGHWLSLYGALWPDDTLPQLQLRTMTGDLPDPSVLDDAADNRLAQSLSFFARLLGAWVAMGFKVPKITIVKGTLRV